MKKIVLISVLAIMLFSACVGGGSETRSETRFETDEGEVRIETTTQGEDGVTITETEIQGEDGETIKFTQSSTLTGDEWCQEGGTLDLTAIGEADSSGTVSMVFDKIETSGKYEGLCHITLISQTPQGEQKIEYWVDESGERGFMEMEMGGQKFTQAFP